MDCNSWDNYTAIGYLMYALDHYNEVVAGNSENGCRVLTGSEMAEIVNSMFYAFDVKMWEEAYLYATE